MALHLTLHFDGSCWPNPGGTAKYGLTLKGGDSPISESGWCGEGPLMSNNLAEFFAMARGLELVGLMSHHTKIASLWVQGDSEIAIKLMKGTYRANKDKLYWPQYSRAMAALQILYKAGTDVSFAWIPREQNTECDELSKLPAAKPLDSTLLAEAEEMLLQ
jgi:ribonuclease HI